MLVLAIVTVPEARVPKPIEFVAAKAAPFISRNLPAVAICKLAPVTFTPPDPPLMVVVLVVLTDPKATVVACAPLPIAIVLAASVPILIVPPPPTRARVCPDTFVMVIPAPPVIAIAPMPVAEPIVKECVPEAGTPVKREKATGDPVVVETFI